MNQNLKGLKRRFYWGRVEKKALSSIIVIAIVVAVVAAIVGVGSYFLLKPSTRENQPRIVVTKNISDNVYLKVEKDNLVLIDFDFGLLDESQTKETGWTQFTVTNVGSVTVKLLIRASDASNQPGEPVTNWILSDTGSIGVDVYAMTLIPFSFFPNPSQIVLGKADQLLVDDMTPGSGYSFGLKVQAPSVITTPARMRASVVLTAQRATISKEMAITYTTTYIKENMGWSENEIYSINSDIHPPSNEEASYIRESGIEPPDLIWVVRVAHDNGTDYHHAGVLVYLNAYTGEILLTRYFAEL
jgi:hypothetical protein